ncbi:threonine/homoserine/homoserine lactone efflux protein [Rhizobium sp. SG_E_25_P2]|jgi:threonine/homoserine/homoserine lactone efflux protein|uniref:hypothetical protein n=1 Tax=Rhizobium sp. SG_E_25_P2 TaxID=2879942 RepID=UPI0024743022|nr:hypothetical protein [Rhizobium sp. SG_E_25_P2]MDH6268848.1 threonine/homoserine/homoserine lactone efflux protein [Rhizobium sp. SG_E_25_P2]
MTTIEFIFAILALLLTPGPTNTLLAVGAAAGGFRASLPYMVAEVLAYLIVVIPLATVAAPLLSAYPMATAALKAGAAMWIFYLAIRLWLPESGQARAVGARHVFITTLLNPKAVIIGLVIMPHGTLLAIGPRLALLAGLIAAASLSWIAFGAFALSAGGRFKRAHMRRLGAVVLAAFSLFLTSSLIR